MTSRARAGLSEAQRPTGDATSMKLVHRTTKMAVIIALGALGACRSATAPEEHDLALARERWAESGIRSYDYVVQRSCFCAPAFVRPITVSVTNGVVTREVFADTGEPVTNSVLDFGTVESLFAVVDTAVARHVDRIDASYDPVSGVPVSISIDPSFQTADEEVSYVVSVFRAR